MFGMCFNKRVLGALAIVGIGIFVVAPNMLWAALPLLLMAACPLSMLFMVKGMSGSRQPTTVDRQEDRSALIDAEFRTGPALDRGDQVALLRSQLLRVGEQQVALSDQLARLEATDSTIKTPVHVLERVVKAPATRTN